MKLTEAAQLAEVLARPMPWATWVGALPTAPPDAILWLRPPTVAEALVAQRSVAIQQGAGYEASAGDAEVIARCCYWNLAQWLKGEDEIQDAVDADLELVFTGGAEVLELLGDPAVVGSPAESILQAIHDCSGGTATILPAEEMKPASPRDWREGARAHGSGGWIGGGLPQEPEAAFWVRPYSEAEHQAALGVTRMPVGGKALATIADAMYPRLLSDVVRAGPHGAPLMTVTEAEGLPYGCALTLARAAQVLALGGRTPDLTFRAPLAGANGTGSGAAEPLDRESPASVAGGADGGHA